MSSIHCVEHDDCLSEVSVELGNDNSNLVFEMFPAVKMFGHRGALEPTLAYQTENAATTNNKLKIAMLDVGHLKVLALEAKGFVC